MSNSLRDTTANYKGKLRKLLIVEFVSGLICLLTVAAVFFFIFYFLLLFVAKTRKINEYLLNVFKDNKKEDLRELLVLKLCKVINCNQSDYKIRL